MKKFGGFILTVRGLFRVLVTSKKRIIDTRKGDCPKDTKTQFVFNVSTFLFLLTGSIPEPTPPGAGN